MSDNKITREEMIGWFGSEMPIEAVNLVWSAEGDKTLGQIRAELRAMGEKWKSRPAGMVERVAEAIRRNKFERSGRLAVYQPGLCSAEELGEARAAIEAMHEPTEEMLGYGERVLDETGSIRDAYVAMTHAAYSREFPY